MQPDDIARLREALEGWARWYQRATDVDDEELEYLNGEGWDDALTLHDNARAALAQQGGDDGQG